MDYSQEKTQIVLPNWEDLKGNRWRVDVFYLAEEGREMLVELRIRAVETGYALTQTILREFPLARTMDRFFQELELDFELDGSRKEKRVNKEYTDKELADVAKLYRDAFKAHLPVQATVAKALKIPKSTASKQIAAARKRGFLGPATRRRPGERPEMNERST